MPLIELPRALEDYFAFAETDSTRRGRRFSITLPYFSGQRLDQLQWWYHVSEAQEQMFDGTGVAVFRGRAVLRFRQHIERWLANTRQHLHGNEPIPRLSGLPADVWIAPVAMPADASELEEALVPVDTAVNS